MADLSQLEHLVEECKQGNADAYGEIFELMSDSIYRYIVMKVKDTATAQDLTSETFKRGWSSIGRYKKNNFRAYLYRIAHNLVVDHFKSNNTVPIDDDFEMEDTQQQPFTQQLIKEENVRSVISALDKLPPQYKEIITLRFIEELSINDTAKALNKSSTAVRVIQHRAIEKLKEILKNE